MTDLALINDYARAAPIAAWLGFSAASAPDGVLFQLAFSEHHIGNKHIRAIHGGVIAAFLEFSAQAALHARLGGARSLATVNIDIDYLSSTRADDLMARIRFARIGRRLAFADAVAWQKAETEPVAAARLRLRIGDPQK